MAAKPIPDGYHSVTAYLIVHDAAAALAFYAQAFGAMELYRMDAPGGKIGHAEMQLGDCRVMMADEFPEMGVKGPKSLGGSGIHLLHYVPDADATVARAVAAGAKITRPLRDQFYGDRSGTVEDPFGHSWTIATHVEDVSPDEMAKRAEKMSSEQAAG